MKPWQLPMQTELKTDKLRGIGLVTAMLVPLGLLHAWVMAEVMIGLTDLMFLAAMLRRRDFTWARSPWFIAALLWWVWLVFCSIPIFFATASIRMGLVEAIVIIRMLLFAAALQHWLLTTPRTRSIAWWILALSCLWIGVESWQQYLTGKNIFGDHRFGDGALTGPFFKPRAGALYAHLLYLALLPPLISLYAKGRIWQLAALALAVLGVVTSVLIGQRSPTILAGFGLLVAAFFYPQLRRIAIIAAVAAIAFLAATPIISPPTYGKLIGETSRQVAHFALSPYGQIWTRGIVMGQHGLINWADDDKACYELSLALIEKAARYLAAHDKGAKTFGGAKFESLGSAERRAVLIQLLPWLRGRVSSTHTCTGMPASCA